MNTKKAKLFPSNEVQSTSYTIRKATIKDFEQLIRIKFLSKKEELKYSKTLKPLSKTKKHYTRYLKADFGSDHRIIFVAVEKNKIIGMIVGKFYKGLPISKYPKKGYISNLYIDKTHRRKGIGKKLILRILKWFKENNVPHISLEIHVNNKAAQTIYHKLGFEDYTIKMVRKV